MIAKVSHCAFLTSANFRLVNINQRKLFSLKKTVKTCGIFKLYIKQLKYTSVNTLVFQPQVCDHFYLNQLI